MLKFTPEQELAVNSGRAAFNAEQDAMSARMATSHELVGNASAIPLDSWRRIDTRGAVIQRDVLAVFNRLAAANTTPVGVADLVSFYGKVGDSGNVSVSLDGRQPGKADQALVDYEGTPIPVLSSEAIFGWRQMEQIKRGPGSLDVDTIANHQRKVAERLETMVLDGAPAIKVGGSTIYGLRNFPERTAATHGKNLSGAVTPASGAEWVAIFGDLLGKLVADNAYGRVTVFLNYSDYLYASINEFAAGYPKTILARLQEIGQVAEFVPASRLLSGEIIGIAGLATGEWGSILSAMPMVTRPLARHNYTDDYKFQTMVMAAPQFRSDAGGQSNIVHLTKA